MRMGKPLLDRTSWIVSSSCLSSSSFRLYEYVCNLLYKNLAAAYLCWAGWLELYGMTVSVKVGFLCMEIVQFVGVLWIVVSRKFILSSDSNLVDIVKIILYAVDVGVEGVIN